MLKKIIIGILVLSVIGAVGAALVYNAAKQENEVVSTTLEPLANGQNQAAQTNLQQAGQNGSIMVAAGSEGEPWQADGTIVAVDDYGFDLALESGETVYVELGPPDYWQTQGITLDVGQEVSVVGSINDEMIHATTVTLADNQILEVRTESGQPLWSGGVSNSQGQNAGQGDGDHIPDPQAQVDEWITIEGTLMSFQGGNMTMGTEDGEIIAFQTGQPRFFAGQGVTFQIGDEIIVLGFYEGDQFMAGEITQVSTGLRVMLRDPNGRPLWAGPGNGNGNSGNRGNQGGNDRAGGNH
jgi:hypothetical protein